MRKSDRPEAERLSTALNAHEAGSGALPGIAEGSARDTFIEQLIESERRVRYYEYLIGAPLGEDRTVPGPKFNPLKAAVLQYRRGDLDEACWLLFLFVHFG